MSGIINSVRDTVTQAVTNKNFLMILVVTAIFIAIAFWVYTKYVAPKLQPDFADNKEFISESAGGEDSVTDAQIYMFYTDWCPHCKTAMKETGKNASWKPIQAKYNGKAINGVTLTFNEINGEKEEATLNDFESKYGVTIKGYPSIYLIKGDSVIEFEANITRENLTKFLNTTL